MTQKPNAPVNSRGARRPVGISTTIERRRKDFESIWPNNKARYQSVFVTEGKVQKFEEQYGVKLMK